MLEQAVIGEKGLEAYTIQSIGIVLTGNNGKVSVMAKHTGPHEVQ